jgi:hypothetical protein
MITADDIFSIRNIVASMVSEKIQELASRLRLEQEESTPETEMKTVQSVDRFAYNPSTVCIDSSTPNPFPFEIIVDFDDESMPVYVRTGAFYEFDSSGARLFYSTDEIAEAAYSLRVNVSELGTGDIYAVLDKTDPDAIVASLTTTEPTADPDVICVRIGKVSTDGAIEQYVHDHIFVGGTGAFDIRGDRALFKAVTDRAYLTADDTLVAHGTVYNASTMYLYPTWDWIRWPEPES